ncbi:hypothetical protein ZIOFF_042518 [Zingiber officinale]|uniref:Pentatricopeptide repeat-containing protein n=1 Tax=Zingiber officinale TaxID=94328 RepID=A0A8J5KVJ8_ZINOF|nr:hypothetical protein ZIOFF_042518 [Zingiber officinale]
MPPSYLYLRQLHASLIYKESHDVSQWNRLFRDYLSRGFPKEALLVYSRNLPDRIHQPILPLVLKACASLSLVSFARSLHAESVKIGINHELLVGTTFVSVYSKCYRTDDARKMFDEMPEKNAVTFSAMISGYLMRGDMESALELLRWLPERTPTIWALLIEGFMKTGDVMAARCLFDRVPEKSRTVITWTVMVHGYTVNGDLEAARALFDQMSVKNVFVWSSMITGYFKKGDSKEAQSLFEQIPVRNLVNWNALIAGYTQIGCCEKAFEAFEQMQKDGFQPDEFTIASLLSACGQLGSLHHGKMIHKIIKRSGIKMNHFVLNGLIDMYAKCGNLERARSIFNGMNKRNTVCWNSMISGLAIHGKSKEALELFTAMESSEEKPNAITFLVLLSACTHADFVKEGLEIFAKMDKYGLAVGVEHYGCLIDLLGRAGRLAEAYDMIQKMPVAPNEVIWGALLGACKVHMDVEMAAKVMLQLEPLHSVARCDAPYVIISNIYAASEKWQEAERMRRVMQDKGFQKFPGCSSVVVADKEHQFYSGAIGESRMLQAEAAGVQHSGQEASGGRHNGHQAVDGRHSGQEAASGRYSRHQAVGGRHSGLHNGHQATSGRHNG